MATDDMQRINLTDSEVSDICGALALRIDLLTQQADELELVGKGDKARSLRAITDRLWALRTRLNQ